MGGLSSPPLTAAQVGSKIAELTAGAIGTYCWAYIVAGAKSNNTNYAGSGLRTVGIAFDSGAGSSVFAESSGGALAGTWKCMSSFNAAYINAGATLFMRVA